MVGKVTPQGTSVGRPQSSALMKFAILPRHRPGGVASASASASDPMGTPCLSGKKDCGHDHAQQTTVKRHPAIPEPQHRQRISQIDRRVVEDHKSQPPADDHTQNGPGQKGFELFVVHRRAIAGPEHRPPQQPSDQPPADQDAGDIGQRIPADRKLETEERKADQFGRDLGKGQGKGQHHGARICRVRQGVNLDAVGKRGHI